MSCTQLLRGRYCVVLVFLLGLFSATMVSAPAYAQEEDGEGEGDEDYYYYDSGEDENPNFELEKRRQSANQYGIISASQISLNATTSITQAINDSYDFCARLGRAQYLADCMGQQLQEITDAMPQTGDYGDAQRILADAGNKLRRLAAANRAPATPRIRATGKVRDREITTKPLTPVRADRIKEVNEQAAAILEEAETKLLRSAESSDRRLIAYAQMAKAVGSNKTLLRSA